MKADVFLPRQRRRWLRTLQAIWRNTLALWRKFRYSILAFVVVTLLGGFVYGELYALSGRGRIALIDRPYLMLQLMILEAPHDVPEEWYLMLFWYSLPVIFVFIVGNGVADFVRLFFDRSGRSDAWREALVSTYRRHVIVLGAGHVGLRVVRILREVEVDVVVVDNAPDAGVEDELAALRVPLIREDGRSPLTLMHAGIARASAFVACTGDDTLNVYAVMRARDMARSANPDIHIVARTWEDDLAQQIRHFMEVRSVLSSSDLAASAFAGEVLGVQMTQPIHLQTEDKRYSTLRMVVNPGSSFIGQEVGRLQRDQHMDIVLVASEEDTRGEVQPAHQRRLRAGDVLVIFARYDHCMNMAAQAWREVLATYQGRVIVLGAGHVGLRVVRLLHNVQIEVVVIDACPDPGVAEELAALGVTFIQEDARTPEALVRAGLETATAFLACTGDDNLNLYAVMRVRDMTRQRNPGLRIVARMSEDDFATQIRDFVGVSVLSSPVLAAPAFAGEALGVQIRQPINVKGRLYNTLRIQVTPRSFLAGQAVGSLQHDHDMDIVLLSNDAGVQDQPKRETIVQPGDVLVIFAGYDRCLHIAARNLYQD